MIIMILMILMLFNGCTRLVVSFEHMINERIMKVIENKEMKTGEKLMILMDRPAFRRAFSRLGASRRLHIVFCYSDFRKSHALLQTTVQNSSFFFQNIVMKYAR